MAEPYKATVIGYGLSAKIFHIPFILALPSQFKLYGILQRNPTDTNSAASDHPDIKIWRDVPTMLADSAIDIVIISSIPDSHFEYAKASLEAGKHVIVEKPFVPTSQEADKLVEIAKKSGKKLAVYQNRRWDSDFVTLKQIIKEGKLGRIAEFETHFDRHRPKAPAVETWKQKELPANGAIYDLGTHLIDQVVHLFGLPKRVTAFLGYQASGNEDRTGNGDSFTVLLHYQNGMLVMAKAGVVSPEQEQLRYWVRGDKGSFKKYHLDAQEDQLRSGKKVEDEGYAVEPESHHGVLTQTSTDGKVTKEVYPTVTPPTYAEFYRLFGNAIVGNGEEPVKAEEASAVLKLIELAIRSSKTGKTLDI
ncbi:putative NAD binding Rossmann fold oxidoreductase [Patellaria atrata CBS 101060]|uniref:NAD binding Rossmann fold oxidoreductase n=1 Tax=Patellaria atrata CBS 101060 TaxID=1346257 RepID=A0A9P4VPE4_9PEZI|nr:putative NAD binding Rossmann fold oxidoreductase [Patellaria atrata CBS 101060]